MSFYGRGDVSSAGKNYRWTFAHRVCPYSVDNSQDFSILSVLYSCMYSASPASVLFDTLGLGRLMGQNHDLLQLWIILVVLRSWRLKFCCDGLCTLWNSSRQFWCFICLTTPEVMPTQSSCIWWLYNGIARGILHQLLTMMTDWRKQGNKNICILPFSAGFHTYLTALLKYAS